ncbi:hypothetical protein Ae201684_008486 [Aphanomyces euteiches]|uniref:Uncharacterized protein n=1 Tax=Aphanomyces euteiches TaxID=100861 RepID=A0A6G0X589_9STRA|nr:hypothetical protein Ae201684_008486 [Aphanomyces euteiches]
MNMTLASIQTDMTYLLYDLEYLLVSSIDGIGPKMITTRLATECNRNGYTKCILNLRTAIHDKEDQRKLFLEAMATLDDMKHHDELLLTYVPEKYSTLKCERPSAPAIISRGTTFVTLEVLQYYNEKAKVAYYCVYGKETGAGTDVSLNNMEYPGTGSIIFPSPQPLLATISGLQPNESYVFAVAAFDANDQASGLREVVFIRHKWITGYDGQHGTDCAPEGEKPKKTTPRDDKAGAQSRCDEVLISNTSPAKAFVELKTHFSDHKDFVKFACLLLDLQIRSGEKIPKGVLKEVCWQPSLRLSSRAIEVLVQLGASQLYQRENENIAGQIIENIEQTSQSSEGSSRLKEIDVQDMDVYLWSGEVYFLSGYSLVDTNSPLMIDASVALITLYEA